MAECPTKRLKITPSNIRLEAVLGEEFTSATPLIEVYVAPIIHGKHISTVIHTMNTKLPIVDLQHLKRIKSCEIILCPLTTLHDSGQQTIKDYLKLLDINTEYLNMDAIRTTSVAAIPPKTRQQYQTVAKLWPCNFHPNKHIDALVENTLFKTNELELHAKMLQLALKISKLSPLAAEGVIVTDPQRGNLIIAGGYSMVEKNAILHATMVAIDGVARTQNGGAYKEHAIEIDWRALLADDWERFRVHDADNVDSCEYLCTNYDVYASHEPCTMCAMALVHSRAKRVFYVYANPKRGALGSLCKIHAVKELNHHYEVFRVAADDLVYFNCIGIC